MSNLIVAVKSIMERAEIMFYLTPDEVYRIAETNKTGQKW